MAFKGLVRTASVDDQISQEGVQFARGETAAPAQTEAKSATKATLDLVEVDRLLAAGEDVAAHRKLSQWYWQQPAQRAEIQSRLNSLADRIYFQSDVQYIDPYVVQFGDRLDTISRKYNVSGDYLSRLNGVEPQKLRAGQSLKVIQGPFSAVVDVSDFEVTVHAHGYFVTKFPIGIGRDHTTPLGTFKVIDKVIDPEYYGANGVISHDDPSNPLGERWLAITDETGSLRSYGLHGTNDSNSVGKADSQGCIRLKDRDIVDLYDLLTIGSEVIIRE